jgi:hypothetical protein
MKKIIVLFTLLIGFAFTAFPQGTIVKDLQTGPDSLMVDEGTLTLYSPLLDEYWDYSIQIKSTFGGTTGDSTNFTVLTYQSNDPAQDAWILLSALNDTLTTVTDESTVLIEKSDFQGMWLKHVLTSHSQDTMLIETFSVLKQKRSRFF